jgi:hypothetical protein
MKMNILFHLTFILIVQCLSVYSLNFCPPLFEYLKDEDKCYIQQTTQKTSDESTCNYGQKINKWTTNEWYSVTRFLATDDFWVIIKLKRKIEYKLNQLLLIYF